LKKARNIIGITVIIIGAIFYVSENIFGINLMSLFVTDTTAPVVDVSNLSSTVQIDQEFVLGDVTCKDDLDTTCEVTVFGEVDTSIAGVQVIKFYVKDSSGNEDLIEFEVTVFEGLDSSIYIPDGYYDSIVGLSGLELKNALNDIITNHTEYPYTATTTDVWDIMKEADEDPDNPDNVIMFYSGFSWPKACQDATNPPEICDIVVDGEVETVEWNREHIWSKSRGDFEIKEGTTSVLDMGAHTDMHHLVAAERNMNSLKNNRHFEDCNDGDDTNVVDRGYGNFTCNDWEFEPRDEVKGDVARMIFYMAIRYEGELGDMVDLRVINDPNSDKSSKLPTYGDLDDLLRWAIEDPVSEKEIERNQVIYGYQGNRNPFIDMPELIALIWGTPDNFIEYDEN